MKYSSRYRRQFRSAQLENLERRSLLATLSTFLTDEHVDLNVGYSAATQTWSLGPRTASPPVQYTGDQALLYVGKDALITQPSSTEFAFTGAGAGEDLYVLDQNQNPDYLYLGFAAYGVTNNDVDRYSLAAESKGRINSSADWVRVQVTEVAGPGEFSIWQSDATPNVFVSTYNDNVANANSNGLDTTDGLTSDDALWLLPGGHSHYNLGFTEKGRYEVTFQVSARTEDGNNTTAGSLLPSGTFKLYFSVGNVGQLQYSAPTYNVDESVGTATISVNRVNGSDGRISVDYATTNGTASAADFTSQSGTLTFDDLETTKTITIPITEDLLQEGAETIQLTLSAPAPASIADYVENVEESSLLGINSSAILTILASDAPGPTANPDEYAVVVGNLLKGNVLANDVDAEGDPLTATVLVGPTRGALTLKADGSFTYSPNPSFNGSDSFTYRASDATSQSQAATVNITGETADSIATFLRNGHADVGIAFENDQFDLHIHNESADIEYAPDEAVLFVSKAAAVARPTSNDFAFIGVGSGATYYRLPQNPDSNLLFLGLGSEEIAAGTFEGGVIELRLKSIQGPGDVSLWAAELAGPVVKFASSDGITSDDIVSLQEGSHSHFNWGFTKPGRYEVTIEAIATLAGQTAPVSSGDVTYQFQVENGKPVIKLGGTANYTENSSPIALNTGAILEDADSVKFAGGTLKVTNLSGDPADRLFIKSGGTITLSGNQVRYQNAPIGSFTGGFGANPLQVSFNTNASLSAVQELIRSVRFRNASDKPVAGNRTIGYQLVENDLTASPVRNKIVNVVAVNDVPKLSGATNLSYANGAAAITLVPLANVIEPEGNLSGGVLRAKIASGGSTGDRLYLGGSNFSILGGQIRLGSTSTVIGTITPTTGQSQTELVITFNQNATVAHAQQLLRLIRYRTIAGTTAIGTKSIELSLSDASTIAGQPLTVSVNVTN